MLFINGTIPSLLDKLAITLVLIYHFSVENHDYPHNPKLRLITNKYNGSKVEIYDGLPYTAKSKKLTIDNGNESVSV